MPFGFLQRNYGALRGPARTLGALHLIDSAGSGLFMSGSAVYFTVVVGLPAAEVGLGLSLAGFTGFVSSLVLGRISDRVGAGRLLPLLLFVLAACYSLYPLVRSAASFYAVVGLIGALQYGCGPSFGALIAELVPDEDRVPARAALRSLFNVGFSVGALLAVALIGTGRGTLAWLPAGDGLSFLAAGALALRLPRSPAQAAGKPGVDRRHALRDRGFVSVIASSSLLALHSAVLLAGIPLWILKRTDLPHSAIPLILIVNTLLVVLFQVAASKGADTIDGAVRAARRAGIVSVAACALFALAERGGGWPLGAATLAGVLLFTFAELWQSASGFGLGFGLAPERARGEYLGAFQLHVVVQATVGPAVVSFLVVDHGSVGWLGLGLLFLAGTATIGPAARWARSTSASAGTGLAEAAAAEAAATEVAA